MGDEKRSVLIVTVSDSVSAGTREDRSGTLAAAAMERRIPCALRLQEGYDHSYFFVSTFIEEHITFHAEALYS